MVSKNVRSNLYLIVLAGKDKCIEGIEFQTVAILLCSAPR